MGSDRRWSQRKVGLLFELVAGQYANPVVVLDELDKDQARAHDWNRWRRCTLLEPNGGQVRTSLPISGWVPAGDLDCHVERQPTFDRLHPVSSSRSNIWAAEGALASATAVTPYLCSFEAGGAWHHDEPCRGIGT
jgi:hypothetical protein